MRTRRHRLRSHCLWDTPGTLPHNTPQRITSRSNHALALTRGSNCCRSLPLIAIYRLIQNGIQEVVGSIPIGSTIATNSSPWRQGLPPRRRCKTDSIGRSIGGGEVARLFGCASNRLPRIDRTNFRAHRVYGKYTHAWNAIALQSSRLGY